MMKNNTSWTGSKIGYEIKPMKVFIDGKTSDLCSVLSGSAAGYCPTSSVVMNGHVKDLSQDT